MKQLSVSRYLKENFIRILNAQIYLTFILVRIKLGYYCLLHDKRENLRDLSFNFIVSLRILSEHRVCDDAVVRVSIHSVSKLT